MAVGNIIVTYISAISMVASGAVFLAYSKLSNKKLRGLSPLLLSMLCALVLGIVNAVAYFLPEGDTLNALSMFMFSITLFYYTFIIHFFVKITTDNTKKSRFILMLLYIMPTVIFILSLTNGYHNLLISGVYKAADGFGYYLTPGPAAMAAQVYQNIISALWLVLVFLFDRRMSRESRKIRWVFIAVVLLPVGASILQGAFNYLNEIHLVVLMAWLPPFIIAYVFYGYLFTSRRMAVSAMNEEYMVFDIYGNCVDSNEEARIFFRQYLGTDLPTRTQVIELIGSEDIFNMQDHKFNISAQGGKRYYNAKSFPISNGIRQYCGSGIILSEVTELMREVKSLSTLATEDPLTGAKNRRYFNSHAREGLLRAAAQQSFITLLMLDIDHFKKVNDTYGHLVGDEVLKTLCGICMKNLRKEDLLARFGGEEFVVFCENIDVPGGKRTAERIRKAVCEKPFVTSEGEINVSVSIGVYTLVPDKDTEINEILEVADDMMYQAKQSGRNRVVARDVTA